jgi:hypothetical protein
MQTRKSQPEGLAAAQHMLTCETCPDLMFAFEERDLDSPARVLTLGGRKRRGHRRIAALGHAGRAAARRRREFVSQTRPPANEGGDLLPCVDQGADAEPEPGHPETRVCVARGLEVARSPWSRSSGSSNSYSQWE